MQIINDIEIIFIIILCIENIFLLLSDFMNEVIEKNYSNIFRLMFKMVGKNFTYGNSNLLLGSEDRNGFFGKRRFCSETTSFIYQLKINLRKRK